MPCPDRPVIVDRQLWGDYTLPSLTHNGVVKDIGGGDLYQAIEIADESEAADCYVFPNGTPVLAALATTNLAYLRQTFSEAIKISVGAPYVGPVQGPVQIAPRGFDWSTTGGVGTQRVGVLRAGQLHRLKLRLWRQCPLHLLKRRPDGEYFGAITMSAGLGAVAETTLIEIPAYGREDLSVDVHPTISMTGGSFIVRVYGENPLIGSTVLLQTITFTTSVFADVSYEYEGKFDHYRITTEAASVTSLGAPTCTVGAKVRDKP